MELQMLADAADDVSAMETVSVVSSPEEVYDIVDDDSSDFDSWTSIISEMEKTYSGNINTISSVYELFLSRFPLCHEYWKRYADHMARLSSVKKAVEIFERAVQSATYSVGLWVDYCSFSILAFTDPSDVRCIFERGLSFVGKDFLSHKLWDMYIRFEFSQQQWSFLAHILIRALKFPTKSLHKYYDSFREFAAFVEEDMSFSKSGKLEPYAADSSVEVANCDDEIYLVIKELQDSSSVEQRSKALYNITVMGERFYHKACQVHEQIDYFENYMETDFFHVKPLDNEQLENWHNYLDFIEKHEDFDWAVKLYERCLIPCANYPEFWMRYVEFMESKGGRELATFALERATQVFLKNVSELHIFNARFREKIGDIEGARAALLLCDTESDSSFVETAINEANMEKRLGNLDTALDIYDKALKLAADKEKMHIIPILYVHLFRLKYQITGSAGAARDLLIAGIQQVPHSRLLLEELINFSIMHEGSKHLDVVDPIIAAAIYFGSDGSQGLSSKDREDLSLLYLKFVDSCGTTHDIRKAWNRHIKFFPHLIRNTSLDKYPSNRHRNELVETREKMPRLIAKQSSRVRSVKRITHISSKENHKLLTSKNQAIEPHKTIANQFGENEDEISVKENTSFQQSEDNAAREWKRLKHQSKKDASPMIVTPALHKQGENEAEEEHEHEVVSGQNELQVSQKYGQVRTEPEEEEEHNCEVGMRPELLGNLSLNNREKEANDLASRSLPAPNDTMSSVIYENPSTSDLAKKQNETDGHKSESLPNSLGQQNLQQQTDPQQIASQSVETCKTNHMLPASVHASSDSNGQPCQHEPNAHILSVAQMPNHDHPNITKENVETNTWPTSNGQPHNSSSTPIQSTVQYPVQSTEQPMMIPNAQMYNQMWQYQYQQQQNQQQWLQMQQSYLMQTQQQSYIQQPQQYVQQQQQQLQSQQYPFYQQQEQYQQYWYQVYQQQLQAYMQMQQYQQMPQDLNHNQHQIIAMANQMWNGSHDQQGQGPMPSHTPSTHAVIASHIQQNSTNTVSQPTNANAPTTIESPSNHKQSSLVASSGPSRSRRSPSLE